VTRVAVLREPTLPFTSGELGAIQGAASSLRVEVSPLGVRDAGDIAPDIAALAREPNGGMIVLGSPSTNAHRNLIIKLGSQGGNHFDTDCIHGRRGPGGGRPCR